MSYVRVIVEVGREASGANDLIRVESETSFDYTTHLSSLIDALSAEAVAKAKAGIAAR